MMRKFRIYIFSKTYKPNIKYFLQRVSENKAQSGKVTKFSKESVPGYDNCSGIMLEYIRDHVET